MAEGVRPLGSSLTLFGFGGVVEGVSFGHGRGGREGARWAEGSAEGGRSLKRKSRHSGKFWFSDPMVRHDPVYSPLTASTYLPTNRAGQKRREVGQRKAG